MSGAYPWVKVADHVDPEGWLVCPNCGWLALETKPPNLYASELGEPCKYCKTPIDRATKEDMDAAYPHGAYKYVGDT